LKRVQYNLINLKSQIPFFELLREINVKLNAEIYLVGGLIRDLILNRENNDIDLVPFNVDYTLVAQQIKKELNCTAVMFKDNVRLVKDNFIIDVSAPRGKNINEDLGFRDFTINNLALDMNGLLIGNVEDFEKKLIRAVYKKTFDDDPLRIFRAFRFISQIGFDLESNTLRLIETKKNLLLNVASERIFEEMKKMMAGDFFIKAIDKLYESNILEILVAELGNLRGKGINKYHEEDALAHTISAVKIAHKFAKKLNLDFTDTVVLISAMMFHDLGKGDKIYNNSGKFIGHEKISEKLSENIMLRLNYPKKIIKRVTNLIVNHSKLRIYATEGAKNITLQKFIYFQKESLDEHIRVALIDALAKKNVNYINDLYEIIRRIRKLYQNMDFELKTMINGNDLIKMGIKPNPKMKEILEDIHFKLVTKYFKDKNQIEKYIKTKYL
jgi:tRNA nucleotidyltransferase/poly(A) polymerase